MKRGLLALLMFAFSLTVFAQPDSAHLARWQGNKYSMFIHWGIYSVLGGVWNGKNISVGLSEQIQAHAGIYSDSYAAVANSFNPMKWNADSIALLAKNAGMRSVVITSKHHDGFCMFKTATTDFNVVDATPFKRDVVKELSEACRKQGLQFGLYFSLIDWHYPEASPISSHNSDKITPEHFEYNKKQVTELLSNYGPISELWFDMGSQTSAESKEMRDLVHSLQPNCMVSSRLGNDMGDFNVTGDNDAPDYIIGVPWQSPTSFFDETWGYRSWQVRGSEEEKYREKLRSLIQFTSQGGNFLLNIGPRGDGSVVEFEKDILLRIGNWLQVNGEAIYNTKANPFHQSFDWGVVTAKDNKLYLHVLKVPANKTIVLPKIKGVASKVYELGNEAEKLKLTQANNIQIVLAGSFTVSDNYKVIALDFANGYTVQSLDILPIQNALLLTKDNAFKYYSNSGVDYNSRYQSTVKLGWTLQPNATTIYKPVIYYTDEEKGKTINLNINNNTAPVLLDNDKATTLPNAGITWGAMYVSGLYELGIDGLPGDAKAIDVQQSFGGKEGKPWTPKTDWKNNNTYALPAGFSSGYYVLQQIEADKDVEVIIKVTSSDGILIALNGKELFIHNNPLQLDSVSNTILLPLKKGQNQLLVKLFNNFHKQIYFSINTNTPQVIYTKTLPTLAVKKMQYYPVSYSLYNPETIHQDMDLPNLKLEFKR